MSAKKVVEDKLTAKLATAVKEALDDGKAVDIRVLDVRKLTVITDYMIVATGRSSRQVRGLIDRVQDAARANKATVLGIEGAGEGEWVLVDLGGVVVHLMQAHSREFYQLEKLWEERSSVQISAV